MERTEKKSKESGDDGRSGGKKNGKVALAAARRMAETATDVFAFLEARGQSKETILSKMEDHACVLLAQVTKNPGGGRLLVKLRDGTEPDPVRICKPLQVKGRAAPKQFANIMRVGDVVVIVQGDIEGKFTPAQAQRAQRAFDRLGITYPRGFFSVEAAVGEDDEPGFEFDRSAEAEAEAREDESRQLEEARAWAIHNGTEVPLTVADIARVRADYDAKRLAAAAAAAAASAVVVPKAAKARGGAGGADEEAAEAAGFAAAIKGKKVVEEFSFE